MDLATEIRAGEQELVQAIGSRADLQETVTDPRALVITAGKGRKEPEVRDSLLKDRDLSTAAVVHPTVLRDPPGALQDRDL
jgi:hypothetical protein